MSFKKCGSVVDGDDPDYQGEGHDCANNATRISHVYESFSVYVCDIDHEVLEPWLEDTIEDLPEAVEARAANQARQASPAVAVMTDVVESVDLNTVPHRTIGGRGVVGRIKR